ncbi:SRPBCC family protein [Falsigemmobacter faecalis]|uniref:SRPBCC family protein n=1 Tax=Falsigemmobacter faecalis TaxID=2488730 RepID=A0A3P3DTB9_9RHOB|nr:SRPBCC family protein [Falsigemmobacter faecalis]RRH76926.1 SRPBCC family protein [Falsigemmobacter faecalis]
MKFITSEEIGAPVADVWAVLSDIDGLEAEARARGAGLKRLERGASPAWKTEFRFRQRAREVELRIAQILTPELLAFDITGKAAEGSVRLELLPLSPLHCRLTVTSEIRPRTLAARLFLQSLKLARSGMNRRYRDRVQQGAALLTARAKALQAAQ